ncbi:MAG: caspase family protein [Balneolaceae bacterium]|nr:caspase family protein [Balneolaceae bacterium]
MRYLLCILLLASALASGCTSAQWVERDRGAVDSGEFQVLEEERFLQRLAAPTPDTPVLRLELFSRTRYEYARKIRYERTIQRYRLRPGFVIAGLAGAGLGVYLGQSPSVSGSFSAGQRVAFQAAGGLAALVGLLNMKPAGDPQPTGEERLLGDTGTVVKSDTLRVEEPSEHAARIRVFYQQSEIYSENRVPESGRLEIALGERLADQGISGPDPGSLRVEVSYRDSLYRYDMGVEEVLKPYVRVTSPVTQLRSTAEEGPGNILAELVEGSRLIFVDEQPSSRWYRVRYGLSENYLLKTDARIVWDTAQSESGGQAVSVPTIPWGKVDVESNIPILAPHSLSNRALVVTNEHYPAPLPTRSYTHRDGRLITTYLENALGYYSSSVMRLEDLEETAPLQDRLERLRQASDNATNLFVYLAGYADVDLSEDRIRVSYRLTGSAPGDAPGISLEELFRELSLIRAQRKVVVLDLSFRSTGEGELPGERRLDLEQPLRNLAKPLLDGPDEAAVFVASGLDQQSALYLNQSGEDKKHHIFTYYFARAIQQRNTLAGAIQQFLQRNVSYTSRRLHDRPQEIHFFGNTEVNLAGGQ